MQVARADGIKKELYSRWHAANGAEAPAAAASAEVKRGLRNADGSGVIAGITRVGQASGAVLRDGVRTPQPGHLYYRGIDLSDLVDGFAGERRFGFEETAHLLLLGDLPTKPELDEFCGLLEAFAPLPHGFLEDVLYRAPSPHVMNQLARGVLALYAFDEAPETRSAEAELLQALALVARMGALAAHGYLAATGKSAPKEAPFKPGLSLAQRFLEALRPGDYTEDEARLLDICLVLHAEHGGGNNSTFTCRVLSSAGTDLYSAVSGAICSLKGDFHGGANRKVEQQFEEMKQGIADWADEAEVARYLWRVLKKEAGDKSGLIYGMGHAEYTLSDPRAVLMKRYAARLAHLRGKTDEFSLLACVERLTPGIFAQHKGGKPVCANVDLYSGFVYEMMGIPKELFTPLFAMARVVGWCAHRLEELYGPSRRIIRPSYPAACALRLFTPLSER